VFLLKLSYRHFSPYSQPSIVQFISGNLENDVATCNHTQIYISASSEEDAKPLCLLEYAKQHCQQAHQLINGDYRLIQTDIQLLGQVATTPAFSPRSILQFSVADLHQEMRDEAGVDLARSCEITTWWPEAPFLLTNATTRSPLAQRSPPAGGGAPAGLAVAILRRPRAASRFALAASRRPPCLGPGPSARARPPSCCRACLKSAADPARTSPIGRSKGTEGGRCFKYRPPRRYFNHRPPRAVVVAQRRLRCSLRLARVA